MPRLLVLLAAVCFGTTGTAQALGPDAAPVTVGAARLVVGGALLALIGYLAAPRSAAPWPRVQLGLMAGAIAVYQLAFFAAVHRTGVALGTVVALGSAPALAGLAAWVADRERLTRRWAAATALAAVGVALLAFGRSGGAGGADALGLGLAVVAGAGYAAYTVGAKRLLRTGHAPEAVMGRAFGLAGVLLVPVLLVGDAGWALTPGGLALAAFLGVVPTALAYVLFARGLRSLGAGETATLTLAEPLTAALLGVLALGERPGAAAIAGGAVVLAGLLVLAVPAPRRRRRPAVAVAAG
jgi:DME family drug/metabolite transporter